MMSANVKSVGALGLTVWELPVLAFSAQKSGGGHKTLAMAPFQKNV